MIPELIAITSALVAYKRFVPNPPAVADDGPSLEDRIAARLQTPVPIFHHTYGKEISEPSIMFHDNPVNAEGGRFPSAYIDHMNEQHRVRRENLNQYVNTTRKTPGRLFKENGISYKLY